MYSRVDQCPLCGQETADNFLIVKDHFLTGEDFHLARCTNCSLVYTNPRPSLRTLSRYYDSKDYLSHKSSFSLLGIAYRIFRSYNIRYKHQILKKHIKPSSVLDYGCGTGSFLSSFDKSLKVIGVEPNPDARAYCISQHHLEVHENLDQIDKNSRFDLITLWHVLEHVYDLNETFALLRKYLSKEGVMVIAVPNIQSKDRLEFKNHWAAFDVPRHLYHFDDDSIKELFKKHRMRLISKAGLWMDSYYISLQSLKYRGDSFAFIKSLKYGYASNQSAENTGNYSSNVYIIKKY